MIIYRTVKRKSPKDGSVKYYGAPLRLGYLNLQEIADYICQECTVTPHDVKAVLSSLQEQVIRALLDGKSVRLGDLGSFHVTFSSNGVTAEKDFTVKDIKAVRVQFNKSSAMRAAFSSANNKLRIVSRDEAMNESAGSSTSGSSTSGSSDDNA